MSRNPQSDVAARASSPRMLGSAGRAGRTAAELLTKLLPWPERPTALAGASKAAMLGNECAGQGYRSEMLSKDPSLVISVSGGQRTRPGSG